MLMIKNTAIDLLSNGKTISHGSKGTAIEEVSKLFTRKSSCVD
jgi:hypothetical protein